MNYLGILGCAVFFLFCSQTFANSNSIGSINNAALNNAALNISAFRGGVDHPKNIEELASSYLKIIPQNGYASHPGPAFNQPKCLIQTNSEVIPDGCNSLHRFWVLKAEGQWIYCNTPELVGTAQDLEEKVKILPPAFQASGWDKRPFYEVFVCQGSNN